MFVSLTIRCRTIIIYNNSTNYNNYIVTLPLSLLGLALLVITILTLSSSIGHSMVAIYGELQYMY